MHKNRPSFMVGLLNGVGGRIDRGETPTGCFIREVHEETDVLLDTTLTQYSGYFDTDFGRIHLLSSIHTGLLDDAQTITDEKIELISVRSLTDAVVPNLRWLIPLCLDALRNNSVNNLELDYKEPSQRD